MTQPPIICPVPAHLGTRTALVAVCCVLLFGMSPAAIAQQPGPIASLAKYFAPDAEASDPVADELALNRAMLAFSAGNYRDAIARFQPLSSRSPIAKEYLALAHLENGDRVAAAIAAGPGEQNAGDPDLEAGIKSLESRDFAAATASLRKVLERQPDNDYARLLLGTALLENGETESASILIRQVTGSPELSSVALRLDDLAQPEASPAGGEVWSQETDYFQEQCGDCYDSLVDRRWNFTVLTGYQYDSNVVLSPEFVGLGAPTNMSDSSWFIASFGDYRLIQEEERTVGLIMSTYDNFYFSQTNFDLQDYMGGAYANALLGCNWIGGIRYEFHETLLSRRQFATEHRLVPNLTYRQGDFGHMTFFYEYDASNFDIAPLIPALNRTGTVHGLGATQAIYTFGGQGRVFLGYRFEKAFTLGTDFDRDTHMATVRIERPFQDRAIADFEVRQFWDDYENPNSLDFLGRPRQDQRTEVRAGLQYYLNPHASLRLDYTFINSNSNVSNLFDVHFYQYNRHLIAPTFIYDF